MRRKKSLKMRNKFPIITTSSAKIHQHNSRLCTLTFLFFSSLTENSNENDFAQNAGATFFIAFHVCDKRMRAREIKKHIFLSLWENRLINFSKSFQFLKRKKGAKNQIQFSSFFIRNNGLSNGTMLHAHVNH